MGVPILDGVIAHCSPGKQDLATESLSLFECFHVNVFVNVSRTKTPLPANLPFFRLADGSKLKGRVLIAHCSTYVIAAIFERWI